MIKRFKKKQEQRKFYRINDRIFASQLRVLDHEGKQIGILTRFEALEKARATGADLVEIAPQAKPPVAKIINYNKFLYQEEKKKREEKKKAKVSETKEVRLSPFISDNDLQVMIRRGRDFIEDGNKVRLVLKFRGRQITHPEFGKAVIGKVVTALNDVSKVEREPHFEGNQLIAILTLERKKGHGQKDQEISSETVQSNKDGQSTV